jgi:hypothetical protein
MQIVERDNEANVLRQNQRKADFESRKPYQNPNKCPK